MINRFSSRYAAAIWARERHLDIYYIKHGTRFYKVYVPIVDNPLAELYETLTLNAQNPARFKSRYYALRWAKEYYVKDFIVKSYSVDEKNNIRYAIFIPADTDIAIRVYSRLIKEIKHD